MAAAPNASTEERRLAAARRHASLEFRLAFISLVLPICWFVGMGYAIAALAKSRGKDGLPALLANLGVLALYAVVIAVIAMSKP